MSRFKIFAICMIVCFVGVIAVGLGMTTQPSDYTTTTYTFTTTSLSYTPSPQGWDIVYFLAIPLFVAMFTFFCLMMYEDLKH